MSSAMYCRGLGWNFTPWAKYALQRLLRASDEPGWDQIYNREFGEIFKDGYLTGFLQCPCPACHETRQQQGPTLQSDEFTSLKEKLKRSLRLFATCIISDSPLLIYRFLQLGLEDVDFDECMSETELITNTGISPDQARLLLKSKEAFFDGRRVNLCDYLRLTATSPLLERKWLQEEMLALLEKLSLPENAFARRMPKDTKIGDITIKDHTDRTEGTLEGASGSRNEEEPRQVRFYRETPVSMKALGYLMVDVIFFLLDGYRGVSWLDRNRLINTEWLKEALAENLRTGQRPFLKEIDKDTELKRAFELAWVMTCPDDNFGFRKDIEGNDDYGTVSQHFRRTWQSAYYPSFNDAETERSSEAATFSSRAVRPPRSSDYIEIAPDYFRWILLRYGAEKEVHKRCWLRLFKTENKSHIRIDKYRFDKIRRDEKIAVRCSPFTALVTDLQFVPLYAYGFDEDHIGFSAKFESHSHSSESTEAPPVFTFQTIEDVNTFQTELTGRILERDIPLSHMLLEESKQFLSKWKDNNLPTDAYPGRIQLWQILDDDGLKQVHDSESMAQRGGKKPLPRLEIALFSYAFMIVLRVKSRPVLEALPDGSVRIKGSGSGEAHVLKGFCQLTKSNIRNMATGQYSTRFPGLQLFQKGPMERPSDAKKISCEYIEVSFQSDEAKDNLCKFLVDRYHARLIRPA